MNIRHPSEDARLDVRLSAEQKQLIEQAASHQGLTLTGFAVSTLLKAARDAMEQATVTTLSSRDSSIFLDMLEAEGKPNAALKAVARRYKKRRG